MNCPPPGSNFVVIVALAVQSAYNIDGGKMKELLRRSGLVFDRTIDFLFYLGCSLVIFAWLSIVTGVLMRYILNKPLAWSIEVSEYILMYITFLGAAWVLKKEGHVSLDIVLNMSSARTQAALNTITSVLGAIICLIVSYYGTVLTWERFQLGAVMAGKTLEISQIPLLAVLPAGFFLFAVQFLRRAYGHFNIWRTRGELAAEREIRPEEFTDV